MWCSNKPLQIRTKTLNNIKKKYFYWHKFDWVWQTYRISRLGNPTLLKVWDVQKWTHCLTGKISMFCSVASITLLAKILNNAKTISQKKYRKAPVTSSVCPKVGLFLIAQSSTILHLEAPGHSYSSVPPEIQTWCQIFQFESKTDFLMVLSLKR